MKSLIIEGMMCVIGAFSPGNNSFFSRSSLINSDFVNQFDNDSDKKLLSKTISQLKVGDEKSREITLSNMKKVTIVVD